MFAPGNVITLLRNLGFSQHTNGVINKLLAEQLGAHITVYDTKACIKHWIDGNSIKMYNKGGYLLRVETKMKIVVSYQLSVVSYPESCQLTGN